MRRVLTELAIIMLLVGLVPAVPSVAARQAETGKILRLNWGGIPDTLDPQLSHSGQWGFSGLDFEGLTRVDEDLQIVPAAAESWEFSPDRLTLTFHLRDGLLFSDGSPLTAENFRYGAERMCDPHLHSRSASYLFPVVGCEELFTSLDTIATPHAADPTVAAARSNFGVRAVDDRTLEIHLKAPTTYITAVAALWPFIPLRQDLVEASGDEWWADPATRVGNGPFRLESMVRAGEDQHVQFVRNDRYWRGATRLDGIDFLALDNDAALAAYKRGDVEVIWPGEDVMPALEADPVLSREILSLLAPGLGFYTFNQTREPFNDKKVREAFAYAFDRETYSILLEGGASTPTLSWIPSGIPGSIETDAYAFNPKRARQALAESSYGGPEDLPEILWYATPDEDPWFAQRDQWVIDQFRQVLGVEMVLTPITEEESDAMLWVDQATWPQIGSFIWYSDLPDPHDWLGYWTCDSEQFAKYIGYCNPEFDELAARVDSELDPEQRLALAEEGGQLLVADAPSIFAYTPTNAWLVNPSVTGYSTTASNQQWPGWWTPLTVDVVPAQ